MADMDFSAIRALRGDQRHGFEEFCCQLALRERPADGGRFVRVEGAGGDGGVEAYWELPDGTKIGFQAKFFAKLDIRQVEESVHTALKVHPTLTRMVVCAPITLTGTTGRKKRDGLTPAESQQSQWDDAVKKWQQLAADQGRTVEFDFWGESELLSRLLACDPTGGLRHFWFNDTHLGQDWFTRHLQQTVADAGPRYHPQLTVEVPLARALDDFASTPSSLAQHRRRADELAGELSRWPSKDTAAADNGKDADPVAEDLARALDAGIQPLAAAAAAYTSVWETPEGLAAARACLRAAAEAATAAVAAAEAEFVARHGAENLDNAVFGQFNAEYMVRFPQETVDRCRRVQQLAQELKEAVDGPVADAVAQGALLVTGAAGTGKTHGVCDAAARRLEQGLFSVVVLGQKLVAGECWDQVRKILGLPAELGRDAMLAALNAAGEASGAPLIIFVDALNERRPRSAWEAELAGMLDAVRDYPYLRLCLTCRTTFLDAVLPDGLVLPRVEHRGFEGAEFEAVFEFCAHYGLTAPAQPLLQPEYANPLFLQMLCQALAGQGGHPRLDPRLSLGQVVELMLDGAEKRAAKALDVAPQRRLVHRALGAVLAEMEGQDGLELSWARADEVTEALLPRAQASLSLLDFLLRDGLLVEVRTSSGEDRIRFGFERLGEFQFVEHVLDGCPREELDTRFKAGAVFDAQALAANEGLAEALAIVLPERYGLELTDASLLAPDMVAARALVASLPWRSPQSLGEETERQLLRAMPRGLGEEVLDQVFALSARAGHRLGAGWLDAFLRRLSRAQRDAILCWHLHDAWQRGGAARRLAAWALRPDLGAVPEEDALVWSKALLWMCSASDRRVRDEATMAVVGLMDRHPHAWPALLEEFCGVDDEYVTERLLLACYGSLIRSGDEAAVGTAADSVWRHWVAPGLPGHAPLRDHVRCIVELAVARGAAGELISPQDAVPAKASGAPDGWPVAAPAEEETDEVAWKAVLRSVTDGDFATYTLRHRLDLDERPGLEAEDCQNWILNKVRELGFDDSLFDLYDRNTMVVFGNGRGRPEWAERIGKKYQTIALGYLAALVADHFERTAPHRDSVAQPADPLPLQAASMRDLDPTVLLRTSLAQECTAWWAPLEADLGPGVAETAWLDAAAFPDSTRALEVVDPADGSRWLALQAYLGWTLRLDHGAPPARRSSTRPHRRTWMQIRSYLVDTGSDSTTAWPWLKTQNFEGRWMPEGRDWIPHVYASEYPWSTQARRELRDDDSFRQHALPVTMTPGTYEQTLEFNGDSFRSQTLHQLVPSPVLLDGAGLWPDGTGGFRDKDANVVFRLPHFAEPGPAALLVRKEWLVRRLSAVGKRLVWTVLGEQQEISGGFNSRGRGYNAYSRAHRLWGEKVQKADPVLARHRPEPVASVPAPPAPDGDPDRGK
ncbi:hypothetical protein ACFV4P_34025 [Kitasatospora sp. NPDC059795]|uniref:hypothetical protein n=1 Tax=Kitasatospora sp. NPDC059795 TaxID=3346949 RepID=UPI0036571EDA